jgi:hypothetical protein
MLVAARIILWIQSYQRLFHSRSQGRCGVSPLHVVQLQIDSEDVLLGSSSPLLLLLPNSQPRMPLERELGGLFLSDRASSYSRISSLQHLPRASPRQTQQLQFIVIFSLILRTFRIKTSSVRLHLKEKMSMHEF